MRLLCPFCQKPITVADSEAGKTVNCSECGEQFAAPQLFAPPPAAYDPPGRPAWAPSSPSPSEIIREPADRPAPLDERDLPDLPSPDRELSGFRRMVSLPMKPEIIRWIPPAAMTLVFMLTLFPWNGMYPAGYPAYTQSAWQCLFGAISHDPVAEDVMKFLPKLEEKVKSNLWIFPYLLLIVPAVVLAWAGPVVEVGKVKLPPAVEPYWKYRSAALGALLLVMFLFLLAQVATGFGLQKAADEISEDYFKDETASAKTPEQIQRLEIKTDSLEGSWRVKTTMWLRLAIFFHLAAILAAAGEAGLALRGAKPPPRVAALW